MSNVISGDFRIQDIVARVAGVSLKSTTKVLQSFDLVIEHIGDDEFSRMLHDKLVESSEYEGHSAPMHSKPGSRAIEQCEITYQSMLNRFGRDVVIGIQSLDTEKYSQENNELRDEARKQISRKLGVRGTNLPRSLGLKMRSQHCVG